MTVKLAGGRLPLQDLISNVIADARQKLAAAEDKSEEKEEKKVKKLVEYEKKEHGGKVPSVKEEEDEHKKEASAFDFSDANEVEKLASALDHVSEMLKEADAVHLGGESHQGGMVLPTGSMVGGVQAHKPDASKKHNIPLTTPLQHDPSQGKAATQMENNHAKAPGGGGTQKEASVSKIDAALQKMASPKAAPVKDKKASADVNYVLSKMAESAQGGEVLTSKSGEGPKPPSDSAGGNDVRKFLESSEAAVNMKKVDGKKIAKRSLADVLSEPAQSKAHDSKVHENLSNASKGGVKIAQAKALLQKIAAEGCTCEDKGDCKYCKMKAAMKAKNEKSDSSPAGN